MSWFWPHQWLCKIEIIYLFPWNQGFPVTPSWAQRFTLAEYKLTAWILLPLFPSPVSEELRQRCICSLPTILPASNTVLESSRFSVQSRWPYLAARRKLDTHSTIDSVCTLVLKSSDWHKGYGVFSWDDFPVIIAETWMQPRFTRIPTTGWLYQKSNQLHIPPTCNSFSGSCAS